MTNKVNRNQKVMTQSEKDKTAEGNRKQKEIDFKDKETIRQAEVRIFDESKRSLPELLKQRLEVIETAIATELRTFTGLKETRIHQLISRQSYFSTNAMIGYSATELMIVFETYKEVVVKVNEIVLFIPSRASFCAFAGFSTNTFKNNLVNSDDDKRNAYQIIDDYIVEMNLSSSKMKRTDPMTTVYEMKAIHGLAEATAPIQVNVTHNESIETIMNRIDEIKNRQIVNADFKEKESK